LRPLPIEGGEAVAEIKRMFALPGTAGVGSAVLAFLEAEARSLGYAHAWLETRRVNARAVAFYERRGYAPIANYGRYAGNEAAVCFGKPLAPAP
jgi:GNAT superfamily N-acetyltransferase